VVGNKAYIFGGDTAHDGIASSDIHIFTLASSGKPEPDYQLIPALPQAEGGKIPASRTKHAACAFNGNVAVYGGCDGNGESIHENSSVWLFNPEKATWSVLSPANSDSAPGPRNNSKLFACGNGLVIYGGDTVSGPTSDLWKFDGDAETWTQLPTAPASTTNAALANGQLYLISGHDPMSGQLHHFHISSTDEDEKWETFTFATNPIAPGPRARHGGGLLPITTGYGRNYLVYFFGTRENSPEGVVPEDETHDVKQWSDMWTLQLPSSDLDTKPKLNIKEAIKPAKIKDAIRSVFGAGSGKYTWAEAEVQVPDLETPEGKLHPGPRASFGYDIMGDGKTVVFWGGQDARTERVGDGWVAKLE
jgi:hypothetical protein